METMQQNHFDERIAAPDGSLRIRLTMWVGLTLSVLSGLVVAWLVDLLPIYDNEIDEAQIQIWHECPIPIEVSVAFYPDYAQFDQPEFQGVESLVSINIRAQNTPTDSDALSRNGCNFQFWTEHEIIDFKIDHGDGESTSDQKYLDFRPRVGNMRKQYVIEPDPAKFSGSLWLLVPDLSQRFSFTNRRITTYWAMFHSGKARAEPSATRRVSTVIVLPHPFEAKRLFPRSMRLESEQIQIFRTEVEETAGHLTQDIRASVEFSHPVTEQLAQALLIGASTLFGAGISAVMEAFLASGVLRMHRQTVQNLNNPSRQGLKQDQQSLTMALPKRPKVYASIETRSLAYLKPRRSHAGLGTTSDRPSG